MQKVGKIYIGSKNDFLPNDKEWAIVHACKTSHQRRLGYTRPIKDSPHYISFREGNELYLNWVDEPTGNYFKVETFTEALDFIDEQLAGKEVFIHCDLGQSRSPTLAMVYLAKRTDFLEDSFEPALLKFKKEYANFLPSGIIRFVEKNWEIIK